MESWLEAGGIAQLREWDPASVGPRGMGLLIHHCSEVTYPLQTSASHTKYESGKILLQEERKTVVLPEVFCSSDSWK